ncbi:hypothetical protein CsSME_00000645 [Camellia sinensis var. sinensis]
MPDHRYVSDPDSPPICFTIILRGYSEWWPHSRAWSCGGRRCCTLPAFQAHLTHHIHILYLSPARIRSQHIHSQRLLRAGMMILVLVPRTEVTPRRIPRTVTPIQMVAAYPPVSHGVMGRLLPESGTWSFRIPFDKL